ncbi:hypothetical protein B0H21DRAFT_81976 [Amylocystis lapponica]|nr:hypothetical protein B0H21DRAFT_81976 [Amylocystis lapponica]
MSNDSLQHPRRAEVHVEARKGNHLAIPDRQIADHAGVVVARNGRPGPSTLPSSVAGGHPRIVLKFGNSFQKAPRNGKVAEGVRRIYGNRLTGFLPLRPAIDITSPLGGRLLPVLIAWTYEGMEDNSSHRHDFRTIRESNRGRGTRAQSSPRCARRSRAEGIDRCAIVGWSSGREHELVWQGFVRLIGRSEGIVRLVAMSVPDEMKHMFEL